MNNLTQNIKIPNEVSSLLEVIMRVVNALSKWLPDNINSDVVVLCVLLLGLIIAAKIWLAMDPVDTLKPILLEEVDIINPKRKPQREEDDKLTQALICQFAGNAASAKKGKRRPLHMYSSQ